MHCCLLHVAANVAYFRLMTEIVICAPLREDLILLSEKFGVWIHFGVVDSHTASGSL